MERHVSAATQNQAKAALLFLYKEVLGVELPWLDDIEQAKRPARLPTVLTRSEVGALLGAMPPGVTGLIARLLYGAGLRLLACDAARRGGGAEPAQCTGPMPFNPSVTGR